MEASEKLAFSGIKAASVSCTKKNSVILVAQLMFETVTAARSKTRSINEAL
jgi:hypothetical protein